MSYELLNCFMLSVFLFYISRLRSEVKALSKITRSQLQALMNSSGIEFPNEQLFDTQFKYRVSNGLIADPRKYVVDKTGCTEEQADVFITRLLSDNSK
ncbi:MULTISPECIES: hypothetical protein [Pseudoalteromonas]|uniref:Uncharacterized protein n=1 Tax=Pseudoalteromonas amylolytica TaxID=1859457 RepID=A0A1S1MT84_9GAMM|nr:MULTISPECIES: hypothetical protein [Pseudoalteromonas]OHU86040.1 hypothetical protein BFC16_15100 [Pseudoalteromonas sp. JW3]OHU89851.1 hypothetical protein BET10_17215 [Pseudoalteromonas amylolytica]